MRFAVPRSASVTAFINAVLKGSSLLGGYLDSSNVPALRGANSGEGAFLVGNIAQVQLAAAQVGRLPAYFGR